MYRKTIFLLVLFFGLIIILGCSKTDRNPSSPILPFYMYDSYSNRLEDMIATQIVEPNNNRTILGIWSLKLDPCLLESDVMPDREAALHYNVASMIPSPMVVINDYDPVTGVIYVDVTILNPYFMDGYDVRLIIYTDNQGHRLINPDDWTSLHDIPGGLPVNPFKSFRKEAVRRKFMGMLESTESLEIYLPSGNPNITFAIDASYPGNCEEPYEISGIKQIWLEDFQGASREIEMAVLDWQTNANFIKLFCPSITGETFVFFDQITTETWSLTLVNNTGAPAGDYPAYIIASSTNSGSINLYDQVNIAVRHFDSSLGWAKVWGGTDYDYVWDVALDKNRNIYLCGKFSGMCDFDPGSGGTYLITYNETEAYVSILDWMGNFIDVIRVTSFVEEVVATNVAVDSYGDIWVAGIFGEGSDYQFFLRKYNTSGTLLWGALFGDTGKSRPTDLIIDDQSNVYLTGIIKCPVDFDPGLGQVIGSPGCFFVKYDKAGNFQWLNNWVGDSLNQCTGVVIDNNGNYLLSGFFYGICDFDPGPGDFIRTSSGYYDVYIAEYDQSGVFSNAMTWGGSKVDLGFDITTDKDGNFYTGGYFEDTVDFDPGPSIFEMTASANGDLFISKFDSDLDFKWARGWRGKKQSLTGFTPSLCIGTTDDNAVHMLGSFEGNVDFDPTPGVFNLSSNGSVDFFLTRINTDGTWEWTRSWGSSYAEWGYSIAFDEWNNIYAVGYYDARCDFNPGPETDYHTPEGLLDPFLVKVKMNGLWE